MISMKLSTEDKKEEYASSVVRDTVEYPCGLKLYLDDMSYEKLGLKEPPRVGESVMVLAKAYVAEVRENQKEGDVPEHQMCIQITDLDMKMGVMQEDKPIKEKTGMDLAEDIYRK